MAGAPGPSAALPPRRRRLPDRGPSLRRLLGAHDPPRAGARAGAWGEGQPAAAPDAGDPGSFRVGPAVAAAAHRGRGLRSGGLRALGMAALDDARGLLAPGAVHGHAGAAGLVPERPAVGADPGRRAALPRSSAGGQRVRGDRRVPGSRGLGQGHRGDRPRPRVAPAPGLVAGRHRLPRPRRALRAAGVPGRRGARVRRLGPAVHAPARLRSRAAPARGADRGGPAGGEHPRRRQDRRHGPDRRGG